MIRTSTGLQRTQPKTASSHRMVVVPSVTAEILAHHLKGTPRALPNAPLLARPDGRPITRSALRSSWKRARSAAKLEHFTLHDIRAAGLTLAAQSGATLPELMARGGHTTSRAALIYQRTAAERAAVVASNMDTMLRELAQA